MPNGHILGSGDVFVRELTSLVVGIRKIPRQKCRVLDLLELYTSGLMEIEVETSTQEAAVPVNK